MTSKNFKRKECFGSFSIVCLFMANSKSDADQKYLYNGKEQQEETDWLDYGARMYDPSLGRFHTLNPKDEWNFKTTPYHYCQNNPINRIDPTGMQDTIALPEVVVVAPKPKPKSDNSYTTEYGEIYYMKSGGENENHKARIIGKMTSLTDIFKAFGNGTAGRLGKANWTDFMEKLTKFLDRVITSSQNLEITPDKDINPQNASDKSGNSLDNVKKSKGRWTMVWILFV